MRDAEFLYRYFTSSCTVSQCRCFASHKCHLTSFSLDTSCIPKKGHPPPLTCLTAFSLFAARLAKLATGVCKPRSSTVSMVPAYQPRSSAACRRATPGLAQEFPRTNTRTAPLQKHALLVEKETSSVEPVVLQGRGVTAKNKCRAYLKNSQDNAVSLAIAVTAARVLKIACLKVRLALWPKRVSCDPVNSNERCVTGGTSLFFLFVMSLLK